MVPEYSYIDIVYVNQFISRDYQAYNLWNPLSTDEKQLLLNESARILDNLYSYKGYRTVSTQVLEFPRYLQDGDLENDTIPLVVKQSCFDILLFILKTQNFENLKVMDELGFSDMEEYNEITLNKISLKNVPDKVAIKLMKYTKLYNALVM